MYSPKSQRLGNWLTTSVIVILVLLFVGLLVVFYLNRNRASFDAKLMAELKTAKLDAATLRKTTPSGWPQWRGPNRDGISPESGFRTDWPEEAEEVQIWQHDLGKGYSSMAVADGRLYTMFGKKGLETVICLDAEEGKELWRHEYSCDNSGIDYGPGPRSTPCVDGDRVYTVGITGILHCFKTHPEGDQAEIVWKKDLLAEFDADNLRWGVSFSPLVVGDLVYTNPGKSDGNSLAALDKHTGETKWHKLDELAGYSSPIAVELAGKEQIVFFTGVGLVGVAPKTGEVYWRFPWSTSYHVNASTPIVVGDYVFASSGYGKGCVLVKVWADDDGNIKAQKVYNHPKMRNHFSSPVYYQDHVYGFDNEILKCINFRTGEVRWDKRDFGKGSVLLADGYLFILSSDGYLALAEATPKGFEMKAGMQALNGRCWTMPVLVDGLLYVRNEKEILCLNLRKTG